MIKFCKSLFNPIILCFLMILRFSVEGLPPNTEIETRNSYSKTNRMGSVQSESTNQILNRDSYADVAAEYGYKDPMSSSSVQGQSGSDYAVDQHSSGHFGTPSAYHYTIYPHAHTTDVHSGHYGTYEGVDDDDSNGGWLCRTFGGLCEDNDRQGVKALGFFGLIALALKKLKLLPLLPFLPLIIPFLPILLPGILLLGLPLIIAAWYLPIVPVVVVGRAMSVSAIRNVQETLFSENCLERISCEAIGISRGFGFEAPWVQQFLDKASPHSKWIDKISRVGRNSRGGCGAYKCRPVTALQKSFKMSPES